MQSKIDAFFSAIVNRLSAFFADPLLENEEINAKIMEDRILSPREIALSIAAFSTAVSAITGLLLLASGAVNVDYVGGLILLCILMSYVGIFIGHCIVKALGSPLNLHEYASLVVREMPVSLFIGVVGGICKIVGAATNGIPVFIFAAMAQIVPFYRNLSLAKIDKTKAYIVTGIALVISLGFHVGGAVQSGAAARYRYVPPYLEDSGVSIDVGGDSPVHVGVGHE